MRITILGKRWNLRFVPKSDRRDHYGRCEPPHVTDKSIIIESGHPDEIELRTIIHEITHAADWYKDEEYVKRFAADMARVLTRLGWKKGEQRGS